MVTKSPGCVGRRQARWVPSSGRRAGPFPARAASGAAGGAGRLLWNSQRFICSCCSQYSITCLVAAWEAQGLVGKALRPHGGTGVGCEVRGSLATLSFLRKQKPNKTLPLWMGAHLCKTTCSSVTGDNQALSFYSEVS